MPLPIYRLRRLLATTAVVLTLVVAGMYFYARMRTRDPRKVITSVLPYEISKTANGFQISKSDGKRTLFTIQATDVKEFKLNGRAELHGVSIVVYGRDSSRYDQISGDDFSYDPKTGNVTARGDVQIDLVANPAGLTSPDQATPKEIKNPIHLTTHDLVFNKDTGDAATEGRVEFRTPQASGWAVGVKYAGKNNSLMLASQVHVAVRGENAAVIEADHGTITGDPRQVVLAQARLDRAGTTLQADEAVFFLNRENDVQRVLARGNVNAESHPAAKSEAREHGEAQLPSASQNGVRGSADEGEFLLTDKNNRLRTAILTGNVHVKQAGDQPIEGEAGRAVLDFSGNNELKTVHAEQGVRLTQKPEGTTARDTAGDAVKLGAHGPQQDMEVTAPVIDFTVAQGNLLEKAVTSGAAQIVVTPAGGSGSGQRTVVTAGRFEAKFETKFEANANGARERNSLSAIHGEPNARIVNSMPSEPDRVSTSDAVDAFFVQPGGLDSIVQKGNVAYSDQQEPSRRTQAFGEIARYTPADQVLVLTGNPRVSNGAMVTTARTVRMNRATGEGIAEGNVKSTYSDLEEQPDGALLASSSPIHVTARTMTAHNNPGIALYTGNVRLWQEANVIQAPWLQFDRDRRFVTAQGTPGEPVKTILSQSSAGAGQTGKNNQAGPVTITGQRLTYADSERKAHYEGGVQAKSSDFTATSQTADAYMLPHEQTTGSQAQSGQATSNHALAGSSAGSAGVPGQLEKVIALGDVAVREPNRHADGQQLVYTVKDDKFVMTGGPPSIFDAEQGKITGVSLTFFRTDDRVLVEGEASTPVVTQTRMAR